ncbi:MDR family MFS transporter [Paenibacillus massiliensis]|uniref:MDR family MFS transporter n=1 Tax=Paenibacillus massiliensis TaxID=225917 RepID=UPI00037C64ED|nr:MDR family MFS transporter [Paenibacillus massiliensis]
MIEQHRKWVVASLLLGILMAAMDNTIVATAMGTIVADLGGLSQFIWVTSAYMVATMAGMPIFGKLSDMYGRKRFFVFGLIVFLVGSVLCGFAQSMTQLSLFRAIQGIGGGALMPIAFTIIFDIFPPEQRGKMTGLIGAVFGLSSVLGPLLGAYITDTISWHWIFYVNVPIGLLSLALVIPFYRESTSQHKQQIDWIGAITLVIAVVSLMFALELGGGTYDWNSPVIIGLFAIFLLFAIIFFLAERRASDPILPFWLFKRPLFASAQALAFLYGGTFIILTVYIPLFVQAVYGGSATNAGFILTPMMLGSVAGSSIGGIFQTKTTFRRLMTISVVAFFAGMLLLAFMSPETSRGALTLYMALTGFGVGFSFSLLPTASAHQLEPRYRGTANSTNSFLRSLGMTLGVTIFGTIQGSVLTKRITEAFAGQDGADMSQFGDLRQVFQPEVRAQIPPQVLRVIVEAMSDSITYVFLLALVPIALAAVAVIFMGRASVGGEGSREGNGS